MFDGSFSCLLISCDSFYKGVDKEKCDVNEYNFDHPNAIDFDQAYKCLSELMAG